MNKHLVTTLAQHRIFLSEPVEPVQQWLDMRKRMAEEKPFKPKGIKIRYVSDKGGDYWQTPSETQKLKTGDCEDMAILSYFTDGYNPRDAVMFGANRKGVFHAARLTLGGTSSFVYDYTLVGNVFLLADYLKNFKPTYFINIDRFNGIIQDKMYVVQPSEGVKHGD
jgi:hypothetical protein